MIYKRHRQSTEPGGYFQFESELNHKKLIGHGYGGQIKLEDKSGQIWRGTAERGEDQAVYYRFRHADGRMVSGMGHGTNVTLRDEAGRVWKGFVDS